ncbi:hypothetical protein EG888_13335 [Listeria monocytogenes]|jgi:hypothetical protein|uniref:Lmo0312 protein n=3 Tax=Listeria monocytogenes TaxID=1639 RepID=Q8YA50_LISMO|nr:hypothetical protein [Listeria monocytogenes]NP_463842.1 hypothetical protein lmo0312 [Listeria monocytogenes EGD-e]EAD5037514.1 hypothetical protein [Listeria monocytogenes serotype 1/2a]EAE3702145.1 hypothetical protein [Listeria monocytogenes serotype 1/2c]AEO24612.1 conserved hypothetical protein [Listeria monocytogenes FSL R2-561]ANE38189.1 hypothetical protein AAV53_03010 [Listeria monocytogenes]ASH45932.1 hypothetical protein A440_0316 [Listeria monocytogenes serotype 1/2c str. 10-5
MSEIQHFSEFIDGATNYWYKNKFDRCNACDMVNVMLTVFDGDISTPGNQSNKIPRRISVSAKVYDVDRWNQSREELIELLNWVSGDLFEMSFEKNEELFDAFPLELPSPRKECITLFSGGLDSFAGSYYNFLNNISSDYVGYVNKAEERTYQKRLQSFYRKIFSAGGSEVDIRNKYQKPKIFYFQSTRSLLYLSLAISKAISNSVKEIRMYENGILSLNPEFGRYTTKTTHPKTIFLYNKLLDTLGYDIRIVNKFEYETKGEIVENMNLEFKSQIKNTFTCGKSRVGKEYNHTGQCGACIPCILRKISLAAYDNEHFDAKYFVGYKNVASASEKYLKDYINNIGYFDAYVEAIKNEEIFGEISNNQHKFHKENNYLRYQKVMFDKFASEYERFIAKYGIH